MNALFRTIACFLAASVLLLLQGEAFAKKQPLNWPPPPVQAAQAETPTAVNIAAPAALAVAAAANDIPWKSRLLGLLTGVLAGAAVGALFSQRLQTFRRYLLFACLGILALTLGAAGIAAHDWTSSLVGAIASAVATWFLLRMPGGEERDTTLGSAKWADLGELRSQGVVQSGGDETAGDALSDAGLFLGYIPDKKRGRRLHYKGNRHALSIAPNRSGKGATAIVPNLLTYLGSSIVIDVKGENAKMTALRRGPGNETIPGMKQKVYLLDPWNIAKVPGMLPSRFNPIDWVISDAANATENAMLLADSLVPMRDGKDAFWDDEARALATGLILYVAFDPHEEGYRTLSRVRDILVMGDDELADVLAQMMLSPHPVARSTGARTASKELKTRSNVFTTLQSHTHFLDSPVLRESLRASDFRFEDLKTKEMTVYLVLPADRLDAFGRWLRILVQQAITVNARNIEIVPKRPILFMLDEMAALGRLAMVERAFGLMAGFGIQLWGIFQDAAQAKRIYGDGWESFVGNAGVLQYFGSPDVMTAEYMSKLCGVTTMTKFSLSSAIVKPFTFMAQLLGKTSEQQPQTTTKDIVQRQLMYPDELMRMRHPDQLLFIEGCNPIRAKKLAWYEDPARRTLGVNLMAKPAASAAPAPATQVPPQPRPRPQQGPARPAAGMA